VLIAVSRPRRDAGLSWPSDVFCCSDDNDWWEAERVDSGEVGMIPRNYVTLDNNDKESQLYVTSSRSSRFTSADILLPLLWSLGSRVVSVLDSGAEGPGFKSQPRRCRATVLGKLFTPVVPLFTKQRNW